MPETLILTHEMTVVLAVLAFTIFLFAFEIVSVDVAAATVMVLLGMLSLLPGMENLADPTHLFDGFASNAVISIIAVMIIGAGLDRTGLMSQVATFILKIGGRTETRIIPVISSTVGVISSFMQNVGAAALFLPVVSRISGRTGIPMSRLLMPMGFCAILGGTITMVGSSPLILLNDLLPEGMEKFYLFEVTPIGLALVATGILYFVIFGRFVLPAVKNDTSDSAEDMASYLSRVYGLDHMTREMTIPQGSRLHKRTIAETERNCGVRIIATRYQDTVLISPHRDVELLEGADIAVVGTEEQLEKFADLAGLEVMPELDIFANALNSTNSGIAEVVIPPDSDVIGQTLSEVSMRRVYGLSIIALHRGEETHREGLRDMQLQSGDTLVAHCRWASLAKLEHNANFAIVTSDYPHEELRPNKLAPALIFFAIALGLILFTDVRLSLALLVGAMGMVLSGVLNMEEAYKAVSWKTVFLLASLIPLGAAVQNTGTAAWIAQETLALLGDVDAWVLQAAIAVLATFFTLVMSNVGATVLLVPLAVNIAIAGGADPRVFALTVAIATSNSFLIPTHQVNALIMGPGGYRVPDFMRAGGIMTILFLVVSLTMLNVVF